MPREVRDDDGVEWTCVQAYAGLSTDAEDTEDAEKESAARVEGAEDRYHVICTPGGGARSVRLALREEWETGLSDEDLLREIQGQQDRDG